jgi:hypothetical protein
LILTKIISFIFILAIIILCIVFFNH